MKTVSHYHLREALRQPRDYERRTGELGVFDSVEPASAWAVWLAVGASVLFFCCVSYGLYLLWATATVFIG